MFPLGRVSTPTVALPVAGGPTLARGYLKMPEKTAERFVPSPFPESAGRLYRTGDLGRLLPPNGTLEIIGRCDFMVNTTA